MSDQTYPLHTIPLNLVDDPEWNSRLHIRDDRELTALAESMSTNGLLSPITVEEGEITITAKDGQTPSFILIAGSRRRAAAVKLGWPTIPAFVRPASDRLNRVTLNVTENVSRKDLTTFEMARACSEIREEAKKAGEKVTFADIAKRMGVSGNRIQQLVAAYSTLPGEIKEAWKKEGTAQDDTVKILDAPFIAELVSLKDPDKQLKVYKERESTVAEAHAKGGKKAAKKAKKAAAGKASFSVKEERWKAVTKAGLVEKHQIVWDYLTGERDNVPGVIEPDKQTVKKGKDK